MFRTASNRHMMLSPSLSSGFSYCHARAQKHTTILSLLCLQALHSKIQ